MHHFLIPNSKFARYTIQISQIFRVKWKEKKRKGRRREDFRSSFPSEIKKGEKYPLKINRSWSNSRGLKCLEEINFSFFSFFFFFFSRTIFFQLLRTGRKRGERGEISFNQKLASEDKVVLYRQREKCIANFYRQKLFIVFLTKLEIAKIISDLNFGE